MMADLIVARSALPRTLTSFEPGSAVTDVPGSRPSIACLIVPAQWPQLMSSTRRLIAPSGTDVAAEVVVECCWQEHMAALSFE
jgi:hypothetical protein